MDQLIKNFCSLGSAEKIDFLLRLAHALTILARDTYEVGKEGSTNSRRLRAINEVQHRLTAFLVALVNKDSKRFPDDVLAKIILEHPEDAELQRQVQQTLVRLLAQIGAAA